MTTEDIVTELLFMWESAEAKPSLEDLCRDHKDLIPRIAREIELIKKFDHRYLQAGTQVSLTPQSPAIPGHTVGIYIGGGSMGDVWEATDLALNRPVALKVLKVVNSDDLETARQRFEREMRLAARLKHPSIATIFSGDLITPVTPGQAPSTCYFTMELIRGDALDTFVRKRSLTIRGVMELFLIISQGVFYAHREGVIHRDLKHANIRVDGEGHPKILDFGIARDINEGESNYTAKFAGTPGFMSPDQRQGRDASPAMDLYALGCILFDLLCIASPNPQANHARQSLIHQPITPQFARQSIDCLDSKIESILCRCHQTAKAPPFRTAAELTDAVEFYLHPKSTLPGRKIFLGTVAAVVCLGMVGLTIAGIAHLLAKGSKTIAPLVTPHLSLQIFNVSSADHTRTPLPPKSTDLAVGDTQIPIPEAATLHASLDAAGNLSLTSPQLLWKSYARNPSDPMPEIKDMVSGALPVPVPANQNADGFNVYLVAHKSGDVDQNSRVILWVGFGSR